jgi:hypothetical protein
VQNVQVSFVRKTLRGLIGVHDWNLYTEQITGNRVSFEISVARLSSVIPSEVEESLDLCLSASLARDVSRPSRKATAWQATSLDMTIAHSSPSK